MTVTFQLTARDFYDAFIAHRNRSFLMRWLARLGIAISSLVLLMVLLFAVFGRSNPKYSSILENLLPLVFLAVMWTALLVGAPYYVASKQVRNAPWAQGTIELETSEIGIRMHSQHSDSNLAWSAFIRWMEAKTGFLLYLSPYMFWILPKRAFSAEEIVEFRSILATHVSSH